MPDASLSILLLLPPPSLTTHPVRGFKDYFYFGTKKICLATRRRAHVPRSTKKTTRRRTNVSVSFSFRPRSSSSWEFIASLSLLPAPGIRAVHPSRASVVKRTGKEGHGGTKIKANASPKRLRVALVYRWPEMVKRSVETALQASCLPLVRKLDTKFFLPTLG